MNKFVPVFFTLLLCLSGLGHSAAPVLSISAPWEITSRDPSKSGFVFLRLNIAETLVNSDPQGKPLPGLATSWGQSAEGTTWRFTLRQGVLFHDNSPMTVDAVLNSLQIALRKPGVLAKAGIKSITAEGNDIVIALNAPFSPLPAFLAHHTTQILAPSCYDAAGNVNKEVIATGPYRIVTLQPPQKVEMEAFAQYWGNKAKIQQVKYLGVGRGETRALMAESGDAHLVFNIDPASMKRLGRQQQLELRSVPLPRVILFKVNAALPGLSDVRERRALSLALDRKAITRAILRQEGDVLSQLFPPNMQDWHMQAAPTVQLVRHDRDEAERLLAVCGWKKNKSGMLERQGKLFQLELVTFPDRPELPLVAAAIQDQLRAIGIAVSVNIANSSEIPVRHKNNTLQLGLYARNYSLVPNPLGSLIEDFAEQGADWGAMNWFNPTLHKAIADLVQRPDPAGDAAQRALVVRILHEELPLVPVAWYEQTVAISKKTANVVIDPFERSYGLADIEWRQP
ncbi:MAG: ABC transporter substrate-binding protein [bacterium]|nr:ABC transporter substrate-binding protein [bacterium]